MVPLLGHCYNAFWESNSRILDLETGFGMKMLMQGLLQVCIYFKIIRKQNEPVREIFNNLKF